MVIRGRALVSLTAVAVLVSVTGMTADIVSAPAVARVSSCFPETDNGDPMMTDFTVTPATADVTRGPVTIHFRVVAFDTGGPGPATGVKQVTVSLGADGLERESIALTQESDGAFAGALTIPKGTDPWQRDIVGVSVGDHAGMGRHYDIDSLGEHGWPQRIPVKSVRFRGTPRLTSFTMSKETADARSGAVFVRVTARVRTKGIGVTDVFVETGDAAEGPSGGELRRVAGGPKRGTWAGRLRVHHWSTNGGARRPLTVHVFDAALNHGGHFDASALRRMGFPDHLRIINLPDVDQPTVVLRSLQPRVLDLRSSPGRFSVSVRARDETSGVRAVKLRMRNTTQDGDTRLFRLTRTSGTARDGRWAGSFTLVDLCGLAAGRYEVFIQAVDRTGKINSVQPAPQIRIKALDNQRPSVEVDDLDPVAPAGPVKVEFNEIVTGLTSATVLVAPAGPRLNRPPDPSTAVPGNWSCLGVGGEATDCATGPVRRAQFVPSIPFATNGDYRIVFNPEGQLGLADASGNPFLPRSELAFLVAP